jgi:hypothetical protein
MQQWKASTGDSKNVRHLQTHIFAALMGPNANQKINPKFEENFRGPKTNHLLTTIHHESTTNSPSKNHVLPPTFVKTPCKNVKTAFPKKMRKSGSNRRRAKA